MNNFTKILAFLLFTVTILSSCNSVKVSSDYDTKASFDTYKTFAFYKKGIKSIALSDIDKKRILSAIETQLKIKGFTKNAEHPDLLVNISTDAERHIEVNSLDPFYGGPSQKYTSGKITVELIDYTNKKLVWQGTGSGVLNFINTKEAATNKEKQIKNFVTEIMAKYPPVASK